MRWWLLPMVALTGCEKFKDQIDDIKEDYADITNQFVAAGTYLGLAELEFTSFLDEELCLPAEEIPEIDTSVFEQANQAMLFLAQAEFSEDISNSQPISRAEVTLDGLAVPETELDGQYMVGAADGFSYSEGEVIFDIVHAGEDHMVKVTAPAAVDFGDSVTASHATGEGLTVDLAGQGFHSALVMVVSLPLSDEDAAEVTYTNLPEDDPAAMYQLAHPEGSLLGEETVEIEEIDIPGDAFAENGIYAIGVAGLRASSKDDMDNINLLLSGMIAGKFNFTPVCAPDCETLKREVLCQDEYIEAAYDAVVAEIPDADGDGEPGADTDGDGVEDLVPPLDDEMREELCNQLMDASCQQ